MLGGASSLYFESGSFFVWLGLAWEGVDYISPLCICEKPPNHPVPSSSISSLLHHFGSLAWAEALASHLAHCQHTFGILTMDEICFTAALKEPIDVVFVAVITLFYA